MGIEVKLHPAIERVVMAVLKDYEISYEELIAPIKTRRMLEARYLVCLLAWELHPEIDQAEAAWSVKRELAFLVRGVQRLRTEGQQQASMQRRIDALLDGLRQKAVSNG